MDSAYNQIVSLIWNIADDVLRDVFLRGQYRDVILPMVVLRRIDALLEPTKEAVEAKIKEIESDGFDVEDEDITDVTGLNYYNRSKWTLARLKSQAPDDENILYDNFVEYLNGFSENVKDVLQNFDYYNKAKKLADNKRLLSIIERITDPHINLTDRPANDPDGLPLPPISNHEMGTLFEELLRRFNEENNEEAGEHFTPRDVIQLLCRMVFKPLEGNLPKIITIHDEAAGSGGMLTIAREYLMDMGVNDRAIQVSGTEINPETYAICKSDLIIKNMRADGMKKGNTITEDLFAGQHFGFFITNPPYGKSWKEDKKRIYHEKQLTDSRYELRLTNFEGEEEIVDVTPRTSDGQMLFMLEELDKMNPVEMQPQGSRSASVHNGSSLFTGDAGSGESNTRRYLIENDLVDCIVQLPNNVFYNTGITTYVWLLTNKKATERRGRVQLIDASQAFDKLRKNLGARNCTIEAYYDTITDIYMRGEEREADSETPISSRMFDGDDFRYYSVTVERPLRLRSQFSQLKIDSMLYDSSAEELSRRIYDMFGAQVFDGISSEDMKDLKEQLTDEDIKVTDKKLATLTSSDKWKERKAMVDMAEKIMHKVGTDVWMNYNEFIVLVGAAAKEIDKKVKATTVNAIARAMSETCEEADPVVKKIHKRGSKDVERLMFTYEVAEDALADYGLYLDAKGNYVEYESDSDLRDSEKICVKEDIYDYFQREVRPYVADAWINIPATKIGCEISFNKYFYKPQPLRSLAENEADIRALDAASQGFIKSLFGEE